MPPPSQLAIATSVVQRLVKEEASYHKELEKQQVRLAKTQANLDGDENSEFQIKQEQAAIEETKAVFPTIRQRIGDAVQKLEDQLQTVQSGEDSAQATSEVVKAQDMLTQAKAALAVGA